MGIPFFFGWLLKKYKWSSFKVSTINKIVDTLYIDANCMLHPSCFKVLEKLPKDTPIEKLENEMINGCIQDLDNLIKYVSPKEKLYVAVDGVAPLAKITQQRKRRYKSYVETQLKNDIKKKYNVPISNWTNASITPGTLFMEKLHNKLNEYLKTLKTPNKIIYSSYHTAGEGEHKIFDYIRNNNDDSIKVVYGLDADLIFLAMASSQKNIYLIRENTEFSSVVDDEQFAYVIIDNLVHCFNEQIYEQIMISLTRMGLNTTFKNIQTCYINDIILICYLLGNDFLPHIPTLDIRKQGLDIILRVYASVYVKYLKPLVEITDDDVNINILFFDDFICQLSVHEKDLLETDNNKRIFEPIFQKPIEREMWMLEHMKVIHSEDVFQTYIGTFDDWKFRYYEYHFGCSESQEQTIKDVCKNYLDGVVWITKYYFNKCPSWDWTYKYNHAPFLTDLSKFIKTQHYNINTLQFLDSQPIEAITQLMCVIPTNYTHLLPEQYNNLMLSEDSRIADMFPIEYELDIMNKDMFMQCIPILPYLDINRVIESVKTLQQTDLNIKINKQFNDISIK